jgi:uncharacterized protein (DUF2384 family)
MLAPFLAVITEPRRGLISPHRLSEALRMPLADLARVTQLHRNTLTRRPDSPKVQARLGEVARIIALASDLTGDPGRAVAWFRYQPLAGFDHKTAEGLVARGQAEAVIKHLEMLADGVYA